MLESLPEMARATNMDTVKVFASSLNTKYIPIIYSANVPSLAAVA